MLLIIADYILWALGTSDFDIHYNEKANSKKQEYLSIKINNDSVLRPNNILITVNDLGMGDGSMFAEGNIKTLNIDRIRVEGNIFENAYTTSPVCAPSRAVIEMLLISKLLIN